MGDMGDIGDVGAEHGTTTDMIAETGTQSPDDTGPSTTETSESSSSTSPSDPSEESLTSVDGSSTTGDPPTECNNGVVENDEQCDVADHGGKTCQSEGFAGGNLSCDLDCTLDTSGCTLCGNGVWEPDAGEACDDMDLGESETCADVGLGLTSEMLGCTSNCTHDYRPCSGCGDGNLMDPEACEPATMTGAPENLNGQTCQSLGFDTGTVTCSASCQFDTSACVTAPKLAAILNTDAFTSMFLHQMADGLVGRVAIMVPGDVATSSLAFSPNNGSDKLEVKLKDGGTTFAMCTASADGQPCDLGSSIDMTGHNAKVVVAEVTETNGSGNVGALTITVSATTSGISSSMSTTSTWRSGDNFLSFPADYVIWPVGTATPAAMFTYAWSTSASGDTEQYSAAVISPGGTQSSPQEFSQGTMPPPPDVSTWPRASSPAGWYLFGTSTHELYAGGETWTLTVQP